MPENQIKAKNIDIYIQRVPYENISEILKLLDKIK